MTINPFKFHVAYCNGRKSEEGFWTYDETSLRAESALKVRLSLLMISHSRADIWKETPPISRQVIRVDAEKAFKLPRSEKQLTHALERTLPFKIEAVLENVVQELLLGERTIVWVSTRKSVDVVLTAFEKYVRKDVKKLTRQNFRAWAVHGDTSQKTRNDVAAEFRAHTGAGLFVATIQSMTESVNLFGASSEHFAQLVYQAGQMLQAESRPYLKETPHLGVYYYVAKGTVDERTIEVLLPKMSVLEKMFDNPDAAGTVSAFREQEKESVADFLARMAEGTDAEVSFDEDDDELREVTDEIS
jgi:hypothetical protein